MYIPKKVVFCRLWQTIPKCEFSTTNKHLQNYIQNTAIKRKICIVGAGPAGFYAAQYLLKHLNDCTVDILEKLPVPFGLVRFGVAPDHPEVKNVINTFSKTAENKHFRFFGNINLGTDITLNELRQQYHAVLLTYGADQDRQLNIPNENQEHVLSARKFVAWYNGLPGAEKLQPNLNRRHVTIVGQGNVAIDVARMLLSSPDALSKTDITEYALETLSRSQIQCVHLVGRRGPLQAAYTIKELREMLKLPNVQTCWRAQDFEHIPAQLDKLQRPRKRITELMLKSLNEQAGIKPYNGSKQFLPIFLRAPKSIGQTEMGFSVTKLEANNAVSTAEIEKLPTDLVLRSIGYKSSCVDENICFDATSGHVHNREGRVYKDATKREIDPGLYAAGWLATGPTGVILTTMNNAFIVAKFMCDDIQSGAVDTTSPKSGFNTCDKRVVTWQGWQRINQAETEAGKAKGKPREKIVDIERMLEIAGI